MSAKIKAWLKKYNIRQVEMVVSDMAGAARGKLQPVADLEKRDFKLPVAIYGQTVDGDYYLRGNNPEDRDMLVRPDTSTLRLVPWASEPTASVIMDGYDANGVPIDVSPRGVLRRVVAQFDDKGWNPIVAPEVEFYLSKAPERPAGSDVEVIAEAPLSGATDPYGIDRMHELADFFRQLHEHCAAQDISLGAISQELGPAQFEVNFNHGPAIKLADDVFHFKRTLKRTAIAHGMRASFLAKRDREIPGSSLHIHQSVYDNDGRNIFSSADGDASALFRFYLGGLQEYMKAALLLFAPYANSYRRFLSHWSSPINLEWGVDNRTVGLRVPESEAAARRIENRLAGSDVNPYLVIAGTLACGYLGIEQKLEPRAAVVGSAYDVPFALHRHFYGALEGLSSSEELRQILGDNFVDLYTKVKELEYREYQEQVPEWELEHLNDNV